MAKRTKSQRKVKKVLGEFKEGTLKSGSGRQVTNRKQAIAIALSDIPEPELADIAPQVLAGLIRTLRSKIG